MSFTTPRNWQVGDEVTAALLNGISTQISQLQTALSVDTNYTVNLAASTTSPTGYTATGAYINLGNLIWYWFNITLGSAVGSGYYLVSLPVAPAAYAINQGFVGSGSGYVSSSGFTGALGQWDIYSSSRAILRVQSATTTIANVTNTSPLTLVSGSQLGGTILYPTS